MSAGGLMRAHVRAVPRAGFWRAGRHWTHAGEVVAEADLPPEAWAILEADPRIEVSPLVADAPPPGAEAEASQARLRAAIQALGPEGFTARGLPRLEALREHLPEAGELTKEAREAALAVLLETGWAPPAGGTRD
jgi:hypothetical protein